MAKNQKPDNRPRCTLTTGCKGRMYNVLDYKGDCVEDEYYKYLRCCVCKRHMTIEKKRPGVVC